MAKALLEPIIVGNEITSELRRRKSKDIYHTVKASNQKLLRQKVQLEEKDGWCIAKKNIKSTRMAKEKPGDEQLEDEIWCVFAQMGFKEMSQGRQFTISVGNDPQPRQIDIFAKDDETAIIVECTQRKVLGKKSMAAPIQKIRAIRGDVRKSILGHYGRQSRLKVGYVIATRNVNWSVADLAKCKNANIVVLADGEVEYYASLVQHLKRAARYQLLGHIFRGQKINGLATEVLATKGKMGNNSFYTFMVRPDDLLKIAYVGHKASRDTENLETYQRMLQPLRLKKIAKYINEGGKFPTNIVLNIKRNRRNSLKFDVIEKVGDQALGKLHLPPNYASAWIIDGQHRLYGYAYAREDGRFKMDRTTLPVLAFEDLSSKTEMDLFIDINSKQVKVSTSLLVELYADLHWESVKPDEAYEALLSRIASRMNSKMTSPLHDRIIVSGKKKTPYRCLTQTSIRDGLDEAKLVGTMTKDVFMPGPLSTARPEANTEHLSKSLLVLSECLNLFAGQLRGHWDIGDGKGGYLCTNNGIRAIFHVIKDIADHIHRRDGTQLCYLSADETIEKITPYLETLVQYFKGATPQDIQSFRKVGSSLAQVKQQSFGMEAQIHEKFDEFRPPGLMQYLESRDTTGTETAREHVIKIHLKLFDYVIKTLKHHYRGNTKEWWIQGIPLKIRQACVSRWEEGNRQGKEESELNLIDYIAICHNNWDLFKNVISLDSTNKQNKSANTKWIKNLNEIRKFTAHPERGVLSKEQVSYINQLHTKVLEYFPDS